jgi:hypothetical protein
MPHRTPLADTDLVARPPVQPEDLIVHDPALQREKAIEDLKRLNHDQGN